VSDTIAAMKSALPIWKKCARWTAVEAEAVLAAVASSGLSHGAFAAREGLVPERLYSWRRRLGDTPAPSPAEFVEIAASPSRQVEVVFPSGVTLRVAEAIDPSVLRRLAAALDLRGC
jgi:transposase-like protein